MPRARRLQAATLIVAALLLAAGLPALASTQDRSESRQPERAADASLVTMKVKAPNKAKAKIQGKRTAKRVPRPTQLQALTGAAWTTQRKARTARTGRVSYRFPMPATTTQYRVYAPAKTVRVTRKFNGQVIAKRVKLRPWVSAVKTVTIAAPTTSPTQSPTTTPTQAPTASPTQTPTTAPTQTPTTSPTQEPTQEPLDTPWVTGYYAGWYWELGDMLAPEDVDMSAMTHFVFGRVAPGGGSLDGEPNNPDYPGYPYEPGDIVPGAGSAHRDNRAPDGSGRSVEEYLIDRAHESGTKALLMLGGDGEDGTGYLLSTADDVRAEFVDNIVDYLVEHDYDGVDLDWENCLEGTSNCGEADPDHPVPAAEAQRRLMALIADLRTETATRARYADVPALITYPGYALNTNYQTPNGKAEKWRADIANAVDQYNLMSYGGGTTMNGAEWDSWFSGALTGKTSAHPVDIASSVDAYVAAGVPRDRIGLGIGFYGVYWGPTITGPRQNTNNNNIWEIDDNSLGYGYLDRMGYTRNGTRHWDEEAQSTYRTYEQYGTDGYRPPHNPDYPLDSTRYPAGFLSYEDEQSIQAKGDWVKETGAGGAILWTLNYGWVERTQSNPLLDAVKHAFLE